LFVCFSFIKLFVFFFFFVGKVERVVRSVVKNVLGDRAVGKREITKRAEGIKLIGEMYLAKGKSASKNSESSKPFPGVSFQTGNNDGFWKVSYLIALHSYTFVMFVIFHSNEFIQIDCITISLVLYSY